MWRIFFRTLQIISWEAAIVLALSLLNFWWNFFVTILKYPCHKTMPCQPLCKFLLHCAFLPVEAFSKLLEILSVCQSRVDHHLVRMVNCGMFWRHKLFYLLCTSIVKSVIISCNRGQANFVPSFNSLPPLICGSYIVISSVILLCLVWQ